MLAVTEAHWAARGFGPLAVVERASGRVVGEAGLQPLEDGDDIELTYTLAREAWGAGYATEAARAVLRWTFTGLRLARVVAVADPEHAASLRVLEKLGMTLAGAARLLRRAPGRVRPDPRRVARARGTLAGARLRPPRPSILGR